MNKRSRLKTYSHLARSGKIPDEYDTATTGLLYYMGRGFEVETPLAGWYREHQPHPALENVDWEAFSDPRLTTYTRYTEIQSKKEIFTDTLLDQYTNRADASAQWREELHIILSTLRYPCHGLQMLAAYIAQMAPAGRIVIAGLMQTADEMRRVQRLAYAMVLLEKEQPELRDLGRERWMAAAQWQTLRLCIEKMLVTYGWAEAFLALQTFLKPEFDRVFLTGLGAHAARNGDPMIAQLLSSLREDSDWHRAWSARLVELMSRDNPEFSALRAQVGDKWNVLVQDALRPWREKFRPRVQPSSLSALQGATP